MVHDMAESIERSKGVKQALLIVPSETQGQYWVTDGNVRLAGANLLGKKSPLLKCEITNETEKEQLLTMAVTGKFKFSPNPVDEAYHYKRLMDEQGYTIDDIQAHTGIHQVTISSRLKLLQLDSEIQNLIAQRKLPADSRCTKALLSIPDNGIRLKLAQRLAREGITIKAIVAACQRITDQIGSAEKPKRGRPANLKTDKTDIQIPDETKTENWDNIRATVREICQQCEIKLTTLKTFPEPAWSLISHSRQEVCDKCDIKELDMCGECPAVHILRRLAAATENKT